MRSKSLRKYGIGLLFCIGVLGLLTVVTANNRSTVTDIIENGIKIGESYSRALNPSILAVLWIIALGATVFCIRKIITYFRNKKR